MRRRNASLRKPPIWILAAIAFAFALAACGKKAPPVPPDRPPLPKVAALTGSLDGDTVTLSWPAADADQGVRGYVVLRSDRAAGAPECQGCPQVFRKVGEPGIDRDTQTVLFTDTVTEGAAYTYQVQAVGTNGDFGPASNQVVIDRSAAKE